MFLNHFQSFYAMSFCLICGQLAQLQFKCEYQAQFQTNHCSASFSSIDTG